MVRDAPARVNRFDQKCEPRPDRWAANRISSRIDVVGASAMARWRARRLRRTLLRERSEDTNDMLIIPSGVVNYFLFETFGFESMIVTALRHDLFRQGDLAHSRQRGKSRRAESGGLSVAAIGQRHARALEIGFHP
jgi:hypothetical protein